MRGLYPSIQSNDAWSIETEDGHSVYVEESGNPQGIAVIFCHGGPGGASCETHRCFFDPELYRIILFDQRGCGRSTPHAGLENNTTWDLLSDMEFIREHLNIERWVVAGGSWGTTLSLVYAINYPERVLGLILRGIFLAREQDYHWLYGRNGGAAQIFPEHYQEFDALIAEAKEGEQFKAYYQLLTSDNEIERLHAAKVWSIWEGSISTLLPKKEVKAHCSEAHAALSLARLECHYFVNNCFLAENYILDNIDKINEIPGYIIHGRYDVVCKIENAFTLDSQWANGQLQVIPAAGHSGFEPAIADALCRASDEMAVFLNKKDID